MRLGTIGGMALLLAVLAVGEAAAQATAMPTFFAPTRGFGSWEAGATVARPGGDATSLEMRYAAALDRADLGLRGGYVEPGGAGDGRFAAGVEARVPVLGRSRTFPLDGALILGAGRTLGSAGGQTIVPVGLTVGRRLVLDGPSLHVTPYVQPTFIYVGSSVFTFGLGLNVGIGELPDVRLAWARGDMNGFSVGAFWPR